MEISSLWFRSIISATVLCFAVFSIGRSLNGLDLNLGSSRVAQDSKRLASTVRPFPEKGQSRNRRLKVLIYYKIVK